MNKININSFSYANRVSQPPIVNPIPTIDDLKNKFPKEMIDEMVMVIKKHNPEATEEEIVTIIMNNK